MYSEDQTVPNVSVSATVPCELEVNFLDAALPPESYQAAAHRECIPLRNFNRTTLTAQGPPTPPNMGETG